MVYVIFCPAVAGSGESAFVIDKLALRALIQDTKPSYIPPWKEFCNGVPAIGKLLELVLPAAHTLPTELDEMARP
jgi:hypothetical protein